MTEAQLKAKLVKALRGRLRLPPEAVRRHEDKFTGGGADLSVSKWRRTAWVEAKLDRPGRRAEVSELQRTTLRALDGLLLTWGLERGGWKTTRLEDSLGFVLLESRGRRFDHTGAADAIARWIEEPPQQLLGPLSARR